MAVIQLMPTDYLTSVSQEQKWEERCGGGVGAVSELDELFFFACWKQVKFDYSPQSVWTVPLTKPYIVKLFRVRWMSLRMLNYWIEVSHMISD